MKSEKSIGPIRPISPPNQKNINLKKNNIMSKININVWQVIVKVIIAVATTILGAIGIGNGDDNGDTPSGDNAGQSRPA